MAAFTSWTKKNFFSVLFRPVFLLKKTTSKRFAARGRQACTSGRGAPGPVALPRPSADHPDRLGGGIAEVERKIASVSEIFALQGDAFMRDLEKAYLR